MRRFAISLFLPMFVLASCSAEAPPPASPTPARPAQQQKVATTPSPGSGQPSTAPAKPPVNLGPANYSPKDRRDPFHPLVEPPREEKALDIGGYKLSGIVWQRKQYFALLETPDGLGHILKVNDQLGPNARVKEITKDAVLIEMKEETAARRGQVRTIRLELQQKKEEPQQQQRRQEEPPQRREEEPQQRREELPQKREEPQQNKEGQ